MRRAITRVLPEKKESLLRLAASPAIWTLHFLLSYGTAAIWCAKVAGPEGSLSGARLLVAGLTGVALVMVGLIGYGGYQRHSLAESTTPHDFDSPEGRHRFLGLATLLLSGLSAVAILYEAITIVFIETCR